MSYAIATFCYGDRYCNQVNRLILSFDFISNKPNIYVVTDSPESVVKREHVHVKHISEYNDKYGVYAPNYYDFDFSVKRYSLRFAVDSGHTRVLLTDADAVINSEILCGEEVENYFIPNSIVGQVVYSFEEQQANASLLGNRLLHYEKCFGVEYPKKDLWMSEDCVQLLEMESDTFYAFLDTWDNCINIKYRDVLLNTPAGNIDEMSFSALYNSVDLIDNKGKHIQIMIAMHDKWYS